MKNIVVCDIDGCLNNYPKCFVDWVNAKYGLSLDSIEKVKLMLGCSYEDVKTLYRTCGVKRDLEVIPCAAESLRLLRSKGYKVHLVTTRMLASGDDTRYWLAKNKLVHDQLVFTEDKVGYVADHLCRVRLVVEDDPKTAALLKGMGVNVVTSITEVDAALRRLPGE